MAFTRRGSTVLATTGVAWSILHRATHGVARLGVADSVFLDQEVAPLAPATVDDLDIPERPQLGDNGAEFGPRDTGEFADTLLAEPGDAGLGVNGLTDRAQHLEMPSFETSIRQRSGGHHDEVPERHGASIPIAAAGGACVFPIGAVSIS